MERVIIKKGRNCKVFCCVHGCNSKGTRDRTLSFHLFPKKGQNKVKFTTKFGEERIDRRLAWTLRTKIGKKISNYMKVCSKHFKPSDFCYAGKNKVKKILLKTAIPSRNLPKRKFEKSPVRRNPTPRFKPTTQSCSYENEGGPSTECFREEAEMEVADALLQLACGEPTLPKLKDISTQVKSGDLLENFCNLIDSDKKLNTLTGLPNLNLLQTLCELTHKYIKHLKLSVKECIMITFMKLKHNISYRTIAVLFNSITANTVRNVFVETVSILAQVLKPAVPWLSAEAVSKNMPLCFKNFNKVRIICDCTEIPVEKSKCLCCRIKVYSQYKSDTTVKFMVGVSPAGLITFVSRVYGGRASDKIIFEQSGIINKLSYGDEIMVDKGFLVDDICYQSGIKLVRPPFLKAKKQLSKEESLKNVEIARARVHIERVNQRIKMFKILTSRLPHHLISNVEDIFFLCCAVTNLSAPVLAPDKFE